jgi:hypothetical protein
MVLYSFWNVQVLMVWAAGVIGAATVPNATVFTHPEGPVHEVQVMVVVQQVDPAPHAAFVLKCRK